MIRNATIKKVLGRNEAGQYCFDAVWADDGLTPCVIRYIAPPGRFESYLVDDVVMCALPYGDHLGARIIGLFESSQTEPEDEGNTEIHAREDADGNRQSLRLLADGGRVDLGEGAAADQEQVALHDQLRADVDALHDLMGGDFTALLALIQTQITAGGGGTVVTTVWDAAVNAAAPASKPASNVYAKPEAP